MLARSLARSPPPPRSLSSPTLPGPTPPPPSPGLKTYPQPPPAAGAEPPKDRYRLGLSDGSLWGSAMLATQLNDLVEGGSVKVGTMLRLTEYMINTLNGRK